MRHLLSQLQCVESAWKWRRSLQLNKFLTHVDISFNQFSVEDMQTIGDGLRENHTLIGFHCEGNNATVDALGFVQPVVSKSSAFFNAKEKHKDVIKLHAYNEMRINQDIPDAQVDLKPELKVD